jgi:hypothetical protein
MLAAADRAECGMLPPDVLLFVVCTIRVAMERSLARLDLIYLHRGSFRASTTAVTRMTQQ